MTVGAGVDRRGFDEVSALEPGEPGTFAGAVDPEWTIGGKPNGGYLLAMMGRAATWSVEHDHVIAASAHYLRSPEPGPVDVAVEPLRRGRSASQVRARMSQGGQDCVEALFTTSHLEPGGAPYWTGGPPEAAEVPLEACPPLPSVTPGGRPVALLDQVEVRLEPGSRGFVEGRPLGRGELRGWLRLPEDEGFDPNSLLFAVDAFPPATFDVAFAGWVPTLELTVYVRALPAPGPVRVLHRAHLIDAQRVDESCHVWDATGRLVAQATQLAGIRLG